MSSSFVIFVILGGAVVAFVAYLQWQAKVKRREALALIAAQHGLTYQQHDTRGVLHLPFELFRRGDDQGVENVLSGTLEGAPLFVFDFWYMEESTDSDGHTSRSYYRFTCALADLADRGAMFWPHLKIDKEGVFGRLKDRMGFRDIEFESDAFNRRFEVECIDRRFASTVIDPRMMEFLMMTQGYRFELHKHYVLAAQQRTTAEGFIPTHHVVRSMVDRIPEVTWSLYNS